jgi:hypothetical protein
MKWCKRELAAIARQIPLSSLPGAQLRTGRRDDDLTLLWQIVDFAAIYRIPESIFQ